MTLATEAKVSWQPRHVDFGVSLWINRRHDREAMQQILCETTRCLTAGWARREVDNPATLPTHNPKVSLPADRTFCAIGRHLDACRASFSGPTPLACLAFQALKCDLER
jgi:hypothetical protein